MPNYDLAINAQFQPFSMQELLAPVMSATNSLREVEDAYSKQQTEADQLEYVARLLEQEGSPESMATAQKYRNYQAQIQQAANELSETGNISRGRKTLWDMTRRFASEIVPLKAGYEQLAEAIKTQATTPGSAYRKRVSMSDLADYIADPMGVSMQQGIVDLNNISKMSSDLFGIYQKSLRLSKSSKAWNELTDILTKQKGLTLQQAEDFLEDRDKNSAMSKMYDIIQKKTGADVSWDDWESIQNAIDYGVWNAVGETDASLKEDIYEKMLKAAALKNNNNNSLNRRFTSRNFYTKTEREQGVDDWMRFKNAFTQDEEGNWIPYMYSYNTKRPEQLGNAPYVVYDEFLKKYSILNSGLINEERKPGMTEEIDQKKVNKIVNKYMSLLNNTYDANQHTEYIRRIDEGNYNDILSIINQISPEELWNYDYVNSKDGSVKFDRTEKVDVKDLEKKDIKGARFVASPVGNNVYLQIDISGGKTINVPINAYDTYAHQSAVDNITLMKAFEEAGNSIGSITAGNNLFDLLIGSLGSSEADPYKVKEDSIDAMIYNLLLGETE